MKIFIILFLLISSVFSQDCFDDDFTMQIGLNNLWTSGIQGCEDGIQFLEKNGYTCLTSLNLLNNPFWGSNPNETLANICGCTCEDQLVDYCEDSSACNYGEIGDCQYSELYYDCDGNCVNDFDNDEICDELELNPCEQFPHPGPCFAAIEVFYFNQESQECESTTWGGCNGVVPFWNLNDCLNQCGTFSETNDFSIKKKLIKSFNILGQKNNLKGLVIDIFNDGTTNIKYIDK